MDTNMFSHSYLSFFLDIKNLPLCVHTKIPVNTQRQVLWLLLLINPTLCLHSVIINLIYHSERG